MNEWQTIAWFVGIVGVFVGFIWAMHVDAKKSLFKYVSDTNKTTVNRVERCEKIIDDMIADCSRKKDDFITTKAFDRFEHHLSGELSHVRSEVSALAKRIDDWIAYSRNGKKDG